MLYSIAAQAQNLSEKIKVNQSGYLINYKKIAYANNINPQNSTGWYIIGNTDTLYSGAISSGAYDASSGDTTFILDFSSINKPGIYRIAVENLGVSYPFEISDAAYNNVFKAVAKSFYYQRCGMELTMPYSGKWKRNACHLQDAYVYNGYTNGNVISGPLLNGVGGWHDAGDFGKKIVPAAAAMYHMMKLLELVPKGVDSVDLVLPEESFPMPDLLKEVKYELDWFFTQQRTDGAVYHLITSREFFYTDMSDKDLQTRYAVPVSATATGDYAAIMALASKVYRNYDTAFSDSCLVHALKAWNYLSLHQQIFPVGGYQDPKGINNTGLYTDISDKDERLWAAAELYNATGDTTYKNFFDQNQSNWSPAVTYPGGWQDVHNFAMFTYAFATLTQTGNQIGNIIRSQINNYATWTVHNINTNGYGIALTPDQFYWSNNATVLNYGADLLMAHLLSPNSAFENAALSHLNYILGTNALNLSFVTGIGSKTILDVHQNASEFDGINDPIPGFIPGGPNHNPDPYDMILSNYVTANQLKPAKCYIDDHRAYSCNEVALNIMSGMVFLSGYFYNKKGTPLINSIPTEYNHHEHGECLQIYPNPSSGKIHVYYEHDHDLLSIHVRDVAGKEIKTYNMKCNTDIQEIEFDLIPFKAGIYFCTITSSTKSETIKILIE